MNSNVHIAQAAPGRTILLDGTEYLFFGGTAYLGMQKNDAFRKLVAEGLDKYGPVHGSSRASNLQLAVYREAERALARWSGSGACTVLSSGFMAGQLLVRALSDAGWTLHPAPGCHPALLSGEAVRTESAIDDAPEAHWAKWADELLPELEAAAGKHAILACSVDPLRSRKYDFSFAGRLAGARAGGARSGRELLLVVDDSHGLGVLGAAGEGIAGTLRQYGQVETVVLGSLGKGMGIPAGAIWSTPGRAGWLRQHSAFISASPPAPAGLYAFLKAGDLYREAVKCLQSNVEYFSALVKKLPAVQQDQGLPVFFLNDEAVAAYLLQRQILISSFSYPEPGDKPLSRIVLSALHTASDLKMLAAALNDYFPS